jgi:hypothetical protein
MAGNLILAQILTGITALTKDAEIKRVLAAAREHKQVLTEKRKKDPRRSLTMEDKIALTQGNSEEMIIKNEGLFDFHLVIAKDLTMAKKWFKAPKPVATQLGGEFAASYHLWMLWNHPGYRGYKGNVIMERVTGLSPVARDDDDEEEEEEEEEEVVGAAMAAVRLE